MSAQPIKKKRYEGLIQFQDPLRQVMVCLQAALEERFTTGAQLDFLKLRDSSEASHFLLTSDGSTVGEMAGGLESRHLLMRVEQLGRELPSWLTPELDNKIAAWIDSTDPLTAQYFYQVLAHAVSGSESFCLKQVSAWGAATETWTASNILKPDWLGCERHELLGKFTSEATPLFRKIEKQRLATDGCSVALLLEGPTDLAWKDLPAEALARLAKADRHLIAVNFISTPERRLQIAYITPMRLPLKDLQASTLKGFLLLRDIKETAKLSKSVLAS
ncbi:MAG: hypothetical protein H7318_07600 [Oligoflexus sp.]|nr:hypothetical protein [Oligoflexus sp.]